jgi:hypothetical protein
MKRPREIICAYKLLEELKKKYPARVISPDRNCSDNSFYFFGRPKNTKGTGTVRLVQNGKVYAYLRFDDCGFPIGGMFQIWPRYK